MNIEKKARVIAFYLPQFHPIPENDDWWGKGFTEWTNVGRAKPLFKGHYQPRVPKDLGYYDLRLPEVREAQAEMAKNAGIEGFMYWHYWLGNGKQLLDRPFKEVLQTGKPDFPFCLGWANHSWTNREWNPDEQWKRQYNIIEQLYPGVQDYENHFYYVLDAFLDKRYIKIDNKPIFVIYRPNEIPDVNLFIELWRKLAKKNGLEGVFFIGIEQTNKPDKYVDLGFDGVILSSQWHAETKIKGKILRLIKRKLNKTLGQIVLDRYEYKDIIEHLHTGKESNDFCFPCILPQWDRSPRSGSKTVIYTGSTPKLFKKHIRNALDLVSHKDHDKRLIFLKSWNEWAEGNYVEPDLKFGRGYLDSLRDEIFPKLD